MIAEMLLHPVATFIPSGEGALLIALSPEQSVFLNRRRLEAGVPKPLQPGDRIRVDDTVLRLSGSAPAVPSVLGRLFPLLVLIGLFALSGYAVLQTTSSDADDPQLEEQDAVEPEDPGQADRVLAQQALAEADGLERLTAYARAAEVIEQAEERVKDPILRRDLSRRRARLIELSTRAAGPEVAAIDSEEPLEVEVPTEVPAQPPAQPEVPASPAAEPPAQPTPAAVPPAQPTPGPKPPVRAPTDDFLQRVNVAIERGVEHLQATSLQPTRPGEFALIAFALLRSGVAPTDPTVLAMFAGFEDVPLDQTYDVAAAVLALEARSVERTALGGLPGTTTVARFHRRQLPVADRDRIAGLAEQLVAGQSKGGDWGYPCKRPLVATDNSNTQFAVLALHAAERSGVDIPAACWRGVFDHFSRTVFPTIQARPTKLGFNEHAPELFGPANSGPEDSGGTGVFRRQGWTYYKADVAGLNPTPSMTAAGLSSLVIAVDALQRAGELDADDRLLAERLARNSAVWLGSIFPRAGIPTTSQVPYFLYSLEKAMEVSGIDTLGTTDWYRVSAEHLIRTQQQDGSWRTAVDTSLALLTLNRATLHLGGGTRVRGEPASTQRALSVEVHSKQVDLVARLQELRDDTTPRKEISLLRRAIKALPEQDRPRLVPALAALLAAKPEPTVNFATKQLQALTGEDLDAQAYLAWGQAYVRLYTARAPLDPRAERALTEVLQQPANGPLFSIAVLAAVRGRAVHAIPALIESLWVVNGTAHAEVCSALRALSGADPASGVGGEAEVGAAWRAWLSTNAEAMRRRALLADFMDAGSRAIEARAELLRLGKDVVPELLDAFSARPDATWVAPLLEEITGLRPEPTPAAWREAWSAPEQD